jgi:two-component system, response regulator YesN
VYSILIVDDEEPVLDSYTYLVQAVAEEFSVCGTARSGEQALAMAHQTRPDIVVMDIAMPGMDGLETIKELQRAFPETLYILSTAYERFDLAQRAIPLRVFAYLVKPVSRKRFLETLHQAGEHLDRREDDLTHRLEEVHTNVEILAREEREFLLRITWQGLDEPTWRRYQRMFKLTSDHGTVVTAVSANPKHYQQIQHRLDLRFKTICTEHLGMLLIFVADRVEPHRLSALVQDSAPGVNTGIGSRRSYEEFHISAREAMEAVRDMMPRTSRPSHRLEQVGAIRKAIARTQPGDETCRICREYWSRVFAEYSFDEGKALMVELFTLLVSDLISRTGAPDIADTLPDPATEIAAIESIEDWDAWAGRMVAEMVEKGAVRVDARRPQPLQQAIHYISANYEQPLQLSSLAEYCQVSPGYLSRLFSEHLDTTFNDYLNSVRLNAAEELLRENRRTIKEIAYATGYHDPNYFSRIFKKFRGLSPTTYQERWIHEK